MGREDEDYLLPHRQSWGHLWLVRGDFAYAALIGAWGSNSQSATRAVVGQFLHRTGDDCVLRQRTEAQELGLGGIGWKVALWGTLHTLMEARVPLIPISEQFLFSNWRSRSGLPFESGDYLSVEFDGAVGSTRKRNPTGVVLMRRLRGLVE